MCKNDEALRKAGILAGRFDTPNHSSKVEFVHSFFGEIISLKKSLRLCLTFRSYIFKLAYAFKKTSDTNEDFHCLFVLEDQFQFDVAKYRLHD